MNPPRPGSPSLAASGPSFGAVTAVNVPPRIVLIGVEGFGKTTIAAHAPSPLILMARGETGYLSLRGAGRVPECNTVFDESGQPRAIGSWTELMSILDALVVNGSRFRTVALDAVGGFERLCYEHVCASSYKGDWASFEAYKAGYERAVGLWIAMLSKLDAIAAAHGSTVMLLSHCLVRSFKNPSGPDYDRFSSDLNPKLWLPTNRWADAVLFGNFVATIEKDRTGKYKGMGNSDVRVVSTQRSDSWDAKNRFGMPPEIELGNDPASSWKSLWDHIRPLG